jgi:hypothetical protein
MNPPRRLDESLWTIDAPLRIGPAQLGTRTTIVGLTEGGVLLHSPGPLEPAEVAQIEKLGRVRALVAPNAMHHMFLRAATEAFPEARVFAAPGIETKVTGVRIGEVLGDEPPPLWSADLDQVLVEGAPRLNEVAFLHRASRTLILTDLAFNVRHSDSLLTRLFMRVNGGYGRFGTTRVLRSTFRDRPAIRRAIDRILEWDFERVIVSHGEVLEKGGRNALRDAYAWLQS